MHLNEATVLISLLQPDPEIFELFDDVILLPECQIVYQGPREHVLEFFETCGFKCPERKGTADFLQEVTWLNNADCREVILKVAIAMLLVSFSSSIQNMENKKLESYIVDY